MAYFEAIAKDAYEAPRAKIRFRLNTITRPKQLRANR
jgi:hypothetical protein